MFLLEIAGCVSKGLKERVTHAIRLRLFFPLPGCLARSYSWGLTQTTCRFLGNHRQKLLRSLVRYAKNSQAGGCSTCVFSNFKNKKKILFYFCLWKKFHMTAKQNSFSIILTPTKHGSQSSSLLTWITLKRFYSTFQFLPMQFIS